MAEQAHEPTRREYKAKDYSHLLGTRGFSDEMLSTHFDLYEGYVKHTNKAIELLRSQVLDPYVAGEVRRRVAWEFNGMRLHEFYFDAMVNGGAELPEDAMLRTHLAEEFGSFEGWWNRFVKVGGLRGIGWAVLAYDPVAERYLNTWINEHDAGALAGTHPLLVLDCFEHAYMLDYGTDRNQYLRAFSAAVDWNVIDLRLAQAHQMSMGPK